MNEHASRSKWKRRLLKLGLLLLLGAIINVAVAWGCAYTYRGASGARAERGWFPGPPTTTIFKWEAIGTTWMTPIFTGDRSSDDTDGAAICPCWSGYPSILHGDGHKLSVIAHGWPCRALVARVAMRFGNSQAVSWIIESGHVVNRVDSTGVRTYRFLPHVPIWPGFAINTLFYAGVVWLLFFAPFQFRRWRRMKRGLCPACAYPVGSSDKCTECGKELPLPSRERAGVRVECPSEDDAVT